MNSGLIRECGNAATLLPGSAIRSYLGSVCRIPGSFEIAASSVCRCEG